MRVLYCTWYENSYFTCSEAMRAKGWDVDTITYRFTNYDQDEIFSEMMGKELAKGYDFVFSFDYIPVISTVAYEQGTLYVSWVYDSPQFTLFSKTVKNPCNRIFIFDIALVNKLKGRGVENVYYLPLAYNHINAQRVLEKAPNQYQHEVTFVGSVPDNRNSKLRQIKDMPERLGKIIDYIEEKQLNLYGQDIVESLFTDDLCEMLSKCVNIDMGPTYYDCKYDMLRDFIREDISAIDRKRTLKTIAENFGLTLYSGKCSDDIHVDYRGYTDATNEAPVVFRNSKININVSIRSIQSGMPLRVIDVMGAGGFLISNFQSEMAYFFENGKELVWYESMDEMVDKIGYYLKHDSERETIRANGARSVSEKFTYEVLLGEMLRYVI